MPIGGGIVKLYSCIIENDLYVNWASSTGNQANLSNTKANDRLIDVDFFKGFGSITI